MDKLTKFILAFALVALLAVIIGLGIGNRSTQKRTESLSPPEISKVAAQAKEKAEKTKVVIEKQEEKKQKSLAATRRKQVEGIFIPPEKRVSPSLYPSGTGFYPEAEFLLPPGFEEEMSPQEHHPWEYPPGYSPGEFPSPEEFPQGQYPSSGP
jgi:hypothetical protein